MSGQQHVYERGDQVRFVQDRLYQVKVWEDKGSYVVVQDYTTREYLTVDKAILQPGWHDRVYGDIDSEVEVLRSLGHGAFPSGPNHLAVSRDNRGRWGTIHRSLVDDWTRGEVPQALEEDENL